MTLGEIHFIQIFKKLKKILLNKEINRSLKRVNNAINIIIINQTS
jgi:hypothetical protein